MTENLGTLYNDILFYANQYADRYRFLFPLGIIGIWRWFVWMMKESIGLYYRPKTKPYRGKVSIVTPVYNENPSVFKAALESWEDNSPSEIVAVIDYTDKKCIRIFKEFSKNFLKAILIITRIPGKRAALAAGIKKAKGEIVALVDSDTIWGQNVIKNGLPPFHDPRVAGVATYQSVLNPKTFAQKIFDIQLDLRYRHEFPFLAAAGDALVCLSGRTAFYRRDIILPLLPRLVNETFLGKPVISGDDKRLTYLVLSGGWKVAYQSNSHVYTPGMKDLGSYLKQRIRWSRNSLRADLTAMLDGWPRHHPALFFFQIDKVLQSFVIILSPIFLFISLYSGLYLSAAIIILWWVLSRTVKIYPAHLSHKPHNIKILPGFILYSFFAGILRIYALFTLNTQSWITRWDKSRLPQVRFIKMMPAYFATFAVILLLTYGVYQYKQHTYFVPLLEQEQLLASALRQVSEKNLASVQVLGASTLEKKNLLAKRYQTKAGDTFNSIAKEFGVDEDQLFYANSAKSPNRKIAQGLTLTIPGKDIELKPEERFIRPTSSNPSTIQYDEKTNTLLVRGRGRKVTLKDIRDNGGKDFLEEISPKVWYVKATIYIYHGVTLTLDKNEVTWLKMGSNKKWFAALRSANGDISINGVKITSWDEELNEYDKDLEDGRSFIMVTDNARMDIYNSEIAYLGYAISPNLAISPYGVSWKLNTDKLKKVLLTGEVINSRFHHNYFGAYIFGATGMIWRGNEFNNNTRYGLDLHDDSNGFLIENNKAHHNGTHGIILSKRCMYNTIRNNYSYDNALHGIMLHEKSDFNIIENNLLADNTSGIALFASSNNIVRNNTMKDNRYGIRANVNSNNNTLENNIISGSKLYGIYLYDKANNNLISQNKLENNDTAIYVKSDTNEISKNNLSYNKIGIYFQGSAANNTVIENQIKQHTNYGIYTKVVRDFSNMLGNNDLFRNRKDVMGAEESEP